MALGRLAPVDRATLVYLAVALAFTLARGPRTWPASVLLPLWLLAIALVAAVLAPAARHAGRVGLFVGEFYACFLIVALYTHVGVVNSASGVSYDAQVQRWEGLWFSGRRAAARSTVLLTMATFYLCWAAFLSFPVAGPRYLVEPAKNAATAVPLAVLTRRLLESSSAWGTAFPSSHVAAALVAAACAWRDWRPLGAVLVPAALLLSLATVYCQLHYAVDALAGAALAVAVLIAGRSAGYHSFLRPPGRPRAHGEPS